MTQSVDNIAGLAIPPALAARLQAAAEEQHRSAHDVLRDALDFYLGASPPPAPIVTHRSPAEAAARMIRARQSNVRLDDAALHDLLTHGRA